MIALILENWYNSKRGEVDALRETSARLKQNVGLAINVGIKEHLLLKDREQELKHIKPLAESSFDLDLKYSCVLGTRADLIDTALSLPLSQTHYICAVTSHSIALRHERYRKALIDIFKTNTRIEDEAPSIQFNALFKIPLDAILNISSTTSSNSSSYQAIVAIRSSALLPGLGSSSRADPWMTSSPICAGQNMRRISLDASEDILKFTQSSFALGGLLHRLRSQVTEEEIQALAERSYGLFIWIKTVLSYIASLPWDAAKLKEKDVDELYLRVLRSVAGNSLDYRDAVKSFVGDRTRSFQPLDPDVLVTPEDIDNLRNKLAAVITIDPETEALRVCHPSFLDFVETQARST
ncbi:hypothetical protein EDB87DRAFT_1688753 [Lactarius vividus]|nr:hypothetical protein EDB87DRAFT_1688753 [Lactarius vividus]